VFERDGAGIRVTSTSSRVPLRVVSTEGVEHVHHRPPFPPAKLVSPRGAA
jgi:hypothetical protein